MKNYFKSIYERIVLYMFNSLELTELKKECVCNEFKKVHSFKLETKVIKYKKPCVGSVTRILEYSNGLIESTLINNKNLQVIHYSLRRGYSSNLS